MTGMLKLWLFILGFTAVAEAQIFCRQNKAAAWCKNELAKAGITTFNPKTWYTSTNKCNVDPTFKTLSCCNYCNSLMGGADQANKDLSRVSQSACSDVSSTYCATFASRCTTDPTNANYVESRVMCPTTCGIDCTTATTAAPCTPGKTCYNNTQCRAPSAATTGTQTCGTSGTGKCTGCPTSCQGGASCTSDAGCGGVAKSCQPQTGKCNCNAGSCTIGKTCLSNNDCGGFADTCAEANSAASGTPQKCGTTAGAACTCMRCPSCKSGMTCSTDTDCGGEVGSCSTSTSTCTCSDDSSDKCYEGAKCSVSAFTSCGGTTQGLNRCLNSAGAVCTDADLETCTCKCATPSGATCTVGSTECTTSTVATTCGAGGTCPSTTTKKCTACGANGCSTTRAITKCSKNADCGSYGGVCTSGSCTTCGNTADCAQTTTPCVVGGTLNECYGGKCEAGSSTNKRCSVCDPGVTCDAYPKNSGTDCSGSNSAACGTKGTCSTIGTCTTCGAKKCTVDTTVCTDNTGCDGTAGVCTDSGKSYCTKCGGKGALGVNNCYLKANATCNFKSNSCGSNTPDYYCQPDTTTSTCQCNAAIAVTTKSILYGKPCKFGGGECIGFGPNNGTAFCAQITSGSLTTTSCASSSTACGCNYITALTSPQCQDRSTNCAYNNGECGYGTCMYSDFTRLCASGDSGCKCICAGCNTANSCTLAASTAVSAVQCGGVSNGCTGTCNC